MNDALCRRSRLHRARLGAHPGSVPHEGSAPRGVAEPSGSTRRLRPTSSTAPRRISASFLAQRQAACATSISIAPKRSPQRRISCPELLVFGHASKRASHWIYQTNLCETQDRAALKFIGSDKHGLLEVRMGARGLAAQTIFPPSVHVSGEPIEWEDGGPSKITDIDGDELLQHARRLAAAAEIARNYPKVGGRHDAAFVLGGFLARCGFSPAGAAVFVEAVAAASLQPGDKRRDMARTARDGANADKRAGFPALAETFGADTAKKVADWLDYKGGDEGGGTGVPGESAADRAPLLIWYGEDPPPPPKYLVSNMLPEDGVALIGGQFLLGKTFVGADLSAAVMTGGVFAGEPVMRKGAILWFAAEGEKEIEGRVRAAVENKFGGSGPQPFARQAGGVPLLTDPDALEKLKAHAQEAAKHAQREVRPAARAHRYRHRLGRGRVYRREQRVRNPKGHDHSAGAFARDGRLGAADRSLRQADRNRHPRIVRQVRRRRRHPCVSRRARQ